MNFLYISGRELEVSRYVRPITSYQSLITKSNLPHFLQFFPNFIRCNRNIHVRHAIDGQRIYDGIRNRGWCADCGRFTYAFRAYRVMRRGRDGVSGFPTGRLYGGGDEVVHKCAVEDVALLVVNQFFVHGGGFISKVSLSMSTTQMYAPDGKVRFGGS